MLSYFKNSFLNEYQRWVLWLPVFQAIGICIYFSIPTEPSKTAAIGLLASAIILLKIFWKRGLWRIVFLSFLFIAIGFSAGKIRAEYVAAPKIEKQIYTTLSGNIESIEYSSFGKKSVPRLLLNNLRIDDLRPDQIPAKIRLTVRTKIKGDLMPGDRIITNGVLLPLPPPMMPDSYDFSRWAYFQQIGATGFAMQTVVKLNKQHEENWLQGLRFHLTNFITDSSHDAPDGQAGAITAALITGERTNISPEVNQQMRNSGLTHILSISGMHMSLVAGFFFVIIRYGLGFVGGFSERINIKKLAAFISIIGSFGYLLISGMPSPATRSFLMIFLLLLAVIIDRTPTPMRSVAFAAFMLLLITPEEILNPGFQMSFMAVIALVAVYEIMTKYLGRILHYQGESKVRKFFHNIITYPIGIVITSLFAGFSTIPFAAYHFNQYAAYGLLANLIAMPLSSFWIMPMAVIAVLVAPFGLADEAFYVMSLGTEQLINIAVFIASLDGAAGVWKSFAGINLAIISLGMLWLMLWQKSWRLLGIAPIFLGVYFAMQTPMPDIFINATGKLWAVNMDGKLHITNRRKTFASEGWYKSIGQQNFLSLPRQDLYEVDGKTVSFNCKDADIIFDLVKPRKTKKNPNPTTPICDKPQLITLEQLQKNGTHAIYIDGSNISTENVEQFRGQRLWTE